MLLGPTATWLALILLAICIQVESLVLFLGLLTLLCIFDLYVLWVKKTTVSDPQSLIREDSIKLKLVRSIKFELALTFILATVCLTLWAQALDELSITDTTFRRLLLYTVVSVSALKFVLQAIRIPQNKDFALRLLLFKCLVTLVVISSAFLLDDLGNILHTMTIRASTTTCKSNKNNQALDKHIIFNQQSVDYMLCPVELWKTIRLNILFLAQLYVMYTITTAIRQDMQANKRHYLWIACLAVVKCVILMAAVVTEFDVIEDMYKPSYGFITMFICSFILRFARAHSVKSIHSVPMWSILEFEIQPTQDNRYQEIMPQSVYIKDIQL